MTGEIEELFTKNRFSSGPSLLILILYAPIGILLLILRVFISLQLCLASFLLPTGTSTRKFVLRAMYFVMGIVIQEKDCQKKDEKCRLLIANHITPFDHLAVSLVYPCVSISVHNLPGPLSSLFCYHNFGGPQGREILRSNIQSYLNKPTNLPLVLYPEGGTTNGNVALMKYGSWALDIEKSVLVLGLKVYRMPILHIAPSVLGSSWAADLFYLLFSPVTIFSVRYVGKLTKGDTELVEDFALRAQRETAAVLNLQISNHTVSDKVEYMKRLSREEAAASNPFLNPEVHSMALQVKEVLPYLPLDIIKRDLVRTRNVDMTVTNFLEGNIPEPIPPTTTFSSPSTPTTSSGNTSSSSSPTRTVYSPVTSVSPESSDPYDLNMGAKTFGKSAPERMQSFEERKQQLIEKARQRYFQKHGLKAAAAAAADSC